MCARKKTCVAGCAQHSDLGSDGQQRAAKSQQRDFTCLSFADSIANRHVVAESSLWPTVGRHLHGWEEMSVWWAMEAVLDGGVGGLDVFRKRMQPQ
eukprot:scaffold59678_cov28-Tisochrysis_lutea.AAC.1